MRTMTRAIVLTAAVPAMIVGTGCYQYQEFRTDALQTGQTVHVSLTAPGAVSLAPSIGANATGLNGRVTSRAGTDLTLALTQIDRSNGPEQFLRDEPLTLSLANIASAQVRSFDRPRTLLAIGGIVAAVVAGQIFIDQSGIFSTKRTISTGTR